VVGESIVVPEARFFLLSRLPLAVTIEPQASLTTAFDSDRTDDQLAPRAFPVVY
jgi:hypothetical protein